MTCNKSLDNPMPVNLSDLPNGYILMIRVLQNINHLSYGKTFIFESNWKSLYPVWNWLYERRYYQIHGWVSVTCTQCLSWADFMFSLSISQLSELSEYLLHFSQYQPKEVLYHAFGILSVQINNMPNTIIESYQLTYLVPCRFIQDLKQVEWAHRIKLLNFINIVLFNESVNLHLAHKTWQLMWKEWPQQRSEMETHSYWQKLFSLIQDNSCITQSGG